MEDKLLILRFKQGSSEALRRIYEKYRLYLLKIAVALLNDVSLAEDVVHDVFIRFVQSADKFSINGSLKAYLRTCVVNGVRNRARSNQVRHYVELSQAGPIPSDQNGSDQWAILKEESMKISNALIQVPFEQREVVVLHLHGGMKFREIAKLQAVSTKTIQSRYRYGLNKLRSILNSEIIK
ncbi:MAG: RNA polymerase sigma factor [Planctomycetes bacterium]|nr:RNA polymerase sigma factor [Planctomycetota bacterium]